MSFGLKTLARSETSSRTFWTVHGIMLALDPDSELVSASAPLGLVHSLCMVAQERPARKGRHRDIKLPSKPVPANLHTSTRRSDALDQYITALEDLSDASSDASMPTCHKSASRAGAGACEVGPPPGVFGVGDGFSLARLGYGRYLGLHAELLLLKVNSTQANALTQDWELLVNTWVAFQDFQSTSSRYKFLFLGCDMIEQEHELEMIEEVYKATGEKECPDHVDQVSDQAHQWERHKRKRGDEAFKAMNAEIGMTLREIATSLVPTAFDS